jgi:hypothetical protein
VIGLEEDDHAVGELDASGLLRLKGWQGRELQLVPGSGLGLGGKGGQAEKNE